ncbi:MAG: lipocalin-like domain-containing protein [Vulcanimicrobiaceae bacterium]
MVRGGFAIAAAPYRFVFPRDHFAHDRYRVEWWYFTGHVRSKDGRRFGYELTFFRYGLVPHARRLLAGQSDWRAAQVYPAHFAITDESGRTFVHYETFAREALDQGRSSESSLDVRANGWRLTGATRGGRFVMRMRASGDNNAIDFVQMPEKPPAIHGRGGVSRKGACASCASHYYSFTRLATSGTLRRDGVAYAVDGLSWMDHEFGSSELQPDQSGWDWFSIQLADRREVMLYRLRQKDGTVTPESSGSLVAGDGGVHYLPLRSFSVRALGSWASPHTHATYPSGWLVRVDGIGPTLRLTPTVSDQELENAQTPAGVAYWEGAVEVDDAQTNRRLGLGYVELTGYAQAVSL